MDPSGTMPSLGLKGRIIAILLLVSVVPFVATVAVSSSAITTLMEEKLRSTVASNLHQVRLAVENALESLNRVSQQLTVGSSDDLLDQYLTARSPADIAVSRNHLKDHVSLTAFSNPSVGLVTYWFQTTETYDFETSPVRRGFRPDRWPAIKETGVIVYHVPHPSQDQFNLQTVLSAVRAVPTGSADGVSVYIETALNLTQGILEGKEFGTPFSYLMLDGDDRVVYSQVPDAIAIGRALGPDFSARSPATIQGFYWVKEASSMGWSLVSLIPRAAYDSVRDRWMVSIWILAGLFLVLVLVAWVVLWRWVYRPFRRFDQELGWLENGPAGVDVIPLKIPEFDGLLQRFHAMKLQVAGLIDEVGEKERNRADLEIEKLRYQINPHFLLNSLNTIHWHATIKGQSEIDFISLALIRLLQYNLGRSGPTAALHEELEAVGDYVSLQQTRYDFRYVTQVDVEPGVLNVRVPRFVLQPLVENAIAHGLRDGGQITVTIAWGPDSNHTQIVVSVADEGGPPKDPGKTGMGIGLDYVRRIVNATYDGAGAVVIHSLEGRGTRVDLVLPYLGEER